MVSRMTVLEVVAVLATAVFLRTQNTLLGIAVLVGGLLAASSLGPKASGREETDASQEYHPGKKTMKKMAGAYRRAHIYILLDRSSSMRHLKQGTIDGFNNFIQGFVQKKAGVSFKVTLVAFDSKQEATFYGKRWEMRYDVKCDGVDVNDISCHGLLALGANDYQPSGATPLYDAIAKCIDLAKAQQQAQEAVRILIFSDGADTTSMMKKQDIKEKIEEAKKNKGWNFALMGAMEQDAKEFAREIGIGEENGQNWTFDDQGLTLGWLTFSESLRDTLQDSHSLSNSGGNHLFLSSSRAEDDFAKRSKNGGKSADRLDYISE